MRFFAEISFDGTNFHGWQIQPNEQSVQGIINKWLSRILQDNIHVTGCGRTDAGVHAEQFYFHFDCDSQPYSNLAYKLNSVLPASIAVKQIFSVEDHQHCRFDAYKRTYIYHTHFQKDPFKQYYSYYTPYSKLDIKTMIEVAQLLMQFENFSPLSKQNDDNRSSLCHLYESELSYKNGGKRLELKVSANRFLHNMIRRIMGLLISVGRGKISKKEVIDVMSHSSNFRLNFVAPPEGLFLTGVEYPYINE